MRAFVLVLTIPGLLVVAGCGKQGCPPGDQACLERRCAEKDHAACLELVHGHWGGKAEDKVAEEKGWEALKKAIAANPTTAKSDETSACLARKPLSCLVLSRMFERGEGAEEDPVRAAEYLQMACRNGHIVSCLEAGRRLARNDGPKALEFFDRACILGSVEGCAQKASTISLAVRDFAAAVPAFLKACEMGDAYSCFRLADYHRSHYNGIEAERFLSKACALGDKSGCSGLGLLYTYGTGPDDKAPVGKDPLKARQFYQRACDLGDPEGCARLADTRPVAQR